MIELIPAIDIIDGQCVRLTKGDYAQKKIARDRTGDDLYRRHPRTFKVKKLLEVLRLLDIGRPPEREEESHADDDYRR